MEENSDQGNQPDTLSKHVRMRRATSSETVQWQSDYDRSEDVIDLPFSPQSSSHRYSIKSTRSIFSVSRKSVVDNQIIDAWITKGWTLRQSMIANRIEFDEVDIDIDVAERIQAAQKRCRQLGEVNKILHSTLIDKKMEKESLSTKIKHLDGLLSSANRVERGAREMSFTEVQSGIEKEERRMQDMRLDLGLSISDSEVQISNLESGNEDLQTLNSRNKKVLREQLAEIKERQKAIKHLERQIHVLEGASSSMKKGAFLSNFNHEKILNSASEQLQRSNSLPLSEDGDCSPVSHQRPTSDSSQLPKDKKTKVLEKRAHTCINLDRTTGITARTIEDYKALPGLNLRALLGEG
mmetsp:Transcript_107229/g.167508  ORF Transcript_107229/g.167508 Transcript_107229/m.167508 type:complete len:352 (+) Transcript_107229:79-1134(+)